MTEVKQLLGAKCQFYDNKIDKNSAVKLQTKNAV